MFNPLSIFGKGKSSVKHLEYEIDINDFSYSVVFTGVEKKKSAVWILEKFNFISGKKIKSFEELGVEKISLDKSGFQFLNKHLEKNLRQIVKEVNADSPEMNFEIYNSSIESALIEINKPDSESITLTIKVFGDCHSA